MYRVRRQVGLQVGSLHFRLGIVQLLVRLLPEDNLSGVRAALYRLAFPRLSKRVYVIGKIDLRGEGNIYNRLSIGEKSTINTPCYIDLSAPVTIGSGVAVGNHVVIITGTHEIGPPARRADYTLVPKPVSIGDGAWIGACSIISPGITIGPGSFVTAGSVVTRDVPANAQVAGNPARVVGWLSESSTGSASNPEGATGNGTGANGLSIAAERQRSER